MAKEFDTTSQCALCVGGEFIGIKKDDGFEYIFVRYRHTLMDLCFGEKFDVFTDEFDTFALM